MDHPVSRPGRADTAATFPVVAYASTVQFAPDECTGFPRVESRMLFSCIAGCGVVEVNGRPIDVRPTTIVVMPWGHRVRYRPDPADPYLVHGAHLIPRHRADVPLELTVPHDRSHPLAGAAGRSDGPLQVGPDLVITDSTSQPALATLLRYVAQVWDRGQPQPDVAKALGALLVAELAVGQPSLPQDDRRLPIRLRRALAWVMADISRPVAVADLSAVADCSAATVTRLFRDHLGKSPMAWVLGERLRQAENLLATTRLDIGQVARRVGIHDRFYFSRQFHRRTGMSPSEWRRRSSVP